MKRVRITYDEWKCMLSKRQTIRFLDNEVFQGHVSLLHILHVSKPQIWTFHKETVVCQDGFKWLTLLPKDGYFCITAMMNESGKILLWYIDMIASQGVGGDSVPYFDDLYLDLIVYPDGTIVEDDRDELEEAWRQGDITSEQLALANRTCSKLKEGLLSDIKAFEEFTYQCLSSVPAIAL